MLYARSPEECHFYMELHPCECGEDAFDWSEHQLEQRSGQLVSVYLGACDRCGAQRRFEFEVTGDLPPPPAFGRDEPSRIIDPGEFLELGRRAIEPVPADPAELPVEVLVDAHAAIEFAVAAIAETLKFVPPDSASVPGATLTTDASRQLYAREPEQFGQARLEATLTSYRELLATYEQALDEADLAEGVAIDS